MNRKGKGKGKDIKEKLPMVKNPPWLELPEHIWANILHRLGAVSILEKAEKVCTTWRRVCKDPSMWRVIDMWNDGALGSKPYCLEKMCRYAVDRSRGELVDINMEYFATGELLLYVAERSGKLKRLSIACCYGMICEGLVEAVQKLPFLEELSLTHTSIDTECIEALGRFCPQLKSFELNNSCYMGTGYYSDGEEDERNVEALDIAKNLPALQHLRLIGNSMTNEGLQAILDCCPHLVSLDLRLCQNVSLNDVFSRISGQIKDFKSSGDSLTGFPFGFEPWGDDVDECDMSFEDDLYDDGMYDDDDDDGNSDGMYDDDDDEDKDGDGDGDGDDDSFDEDV